MRNDAALANRWRQEIENEMNARFDKRNQISSHNEQSPKNVIIAPHTSNVRQTTSAVAATIPLQQTNHRVISTITDERIRKTVDLGLRNVSIESTKAKTSTIQASSPQQVVVLVRIYAIFFTQNS